MYISLKDGWVPLADLCDKYKDKDNTNSIIDKINEHNINRILDKINEHSKEKIGNVWIIKESEFVKYIETDIEYSDNKFDELRKIDKIVDKFTSELSKKLNVDTIQSKFVIKDFIQGDYVLKTFLEWAFKCQIEFPVQIYKYIANEESETSLYTKSLLIQQLWNKALKEVCEKDI